MKKIIGNVFSFVVIILVITMSILLLSFNEYRVSEFGNNTLLIIDKDMMDFKAGSAILVNHIDPLEVKPGDYVFYYDTASKNVKTVLSEIKDIHQEEQGEIAFTLPNDYILDGEFIIGKKEDTVVIEHLGSVLSVLESKWGNLFLVVIPAFILCIYEVINFIIELKIYLNKGKRKKKKIIIVEEDDDSEE